jgi:KEOPS complex subunit Pcc1
MQFQIKFKNQKDAEIVLKALEPEILTSPSERSSAHFNIMDKKLLININAQDATSLRASVNSYLRWIVLSQDIIELKNV